MLGLFARLLLGKHCIFLPSAAFAYTLVPLFGIGLREDSRATLETHFHNFEPLRPSTE